MNHEDERIEIGLYARDWQNIIRAIAERAIDLQTLGDMCDEPVRAKAYRNAAAMYRNLRVIIQKAYAAREGKDG